MRITTPLERWRVAEQVVRALDEQIARLGHFEELSLERLHEIVVLRRAHSQAVRRADALWAEHCKDVG